MLIRAASSIAPKLAAAIDTMAAADSHDALIYELSVPRKRWAARCSIGLGLPGYDCRMDQIAENDRMRDFANSNLGPGKRQVKSQQR